jgi:DNA-binding GntR family transcriptional regulator
MDNKRPMRDDTQSQKAYEEIRRRILILEIRPEERLKEQDWAARLKLGRLAVREALTRLHGEGMLSRGAKGGFFVAKMKESDVRDIREIREILEVAALRLACAAAKSTFISDLESACDDFAYMVSKGYHVGACEADRRFHQLIVAAPGNLKLVRAYELCHIPLFHIRLGQSSAYMDDYACTEAEHRAIAAAIKAGDAEKAVELLKSHFARGEDAVLNHISA